MSKARFQGQSLCGAIKYEADSVNQKMGHCLAHCVRSFVVPHSQAMRPLQGTILDGFRVRLS